MSTPAPPSDTLQRSTDEVTDNNQPTKAKRPITLQPPTAPAKQRPVDDPKADNAVVRPPTPDPAISLPATTQVDPPRAHALTDTTSKTLNLSDSAGTASLPTLDDWANEEAPLTHPRGVVMLDARDLPVPFLAIPRTVSNAARETNATVGTILRNIEGISQQSNVGSEIRSCLLLIAGIRHLSETARTNFSKIDSELMIIKDWDPDFKPFIDPKSTSIPKAELEDLYTQLTGVENYDEKYFTQNDILHFEDIFVKFWHASNTDAYAHTSRLSFMYYSALLCLSREYDRCEFKPVDNWTNWRWLGLALECLTGIYDSTPYDSPYSHFVEVVTDINTSIVGSGLLYVQSEAPPCVVSEEYERNNSIPVFTQAMADLRDILLSKHLDPTGRTVNSLHTLVSKMFPRYVVPYVLAEDDITGRDVSRSRLHWLTLIFAAAANSR